MDNSERLANWLSLTVLNKYRSVFKDKVLLSLETLKNKKNRNQYRSFKEYKQTQMFTSLKFSCICG